MSAFARVNKSMYTQDGFVLPKLMYNGKDSDTRIKPLALTNDHGRYMAVTPERTLASVGKCPLDI